MKNGVAPWGRRYLLRPNQPNHYEWDKSLQMVVNFIWVRFVLKRMAAITKKETRLTIPPRWELVAKLFSEGTQSGIEKQQTAQLLTGSREASFDVADGEIQPGGDFAEFKPALVVVQQYFPMPVVQRSDQGHQFDAGFGKDCRVERARFVLSEEGGSESTNTPEGVGRVGNEASGLARRVWRLGTRLL